MNDKQVVLVANVSDCPCFAENVLIFPLRYYIIKKQKGEVESADAGRKIYRTKADRGPC